MKKLLKVKWKTEFCTSREECWCRIVSPVIPVIVDGMEMTICNSGSISQEISEYLVKIHNKNLEL